jgi:hypothetical protein
LEQNFSILFRQQAIKKLTSFLPVFELMEGIVTAARDAL